MISEFLADIKKLTIVDQTKHRKFFFLDGKTLAVAQGVHDKKRASWTER